MKRALVCMRVALLLPLLPLGSCFCSTTTSEGEEPVELDRFVPVKVVSLAESSPVRGAALVRPGTALVVLGKATPDYWAVFDDDSAVHVVARGPVAAPEEATLTWGSSTLTLTHDGAAIVGGTYTGPDGVPVAFDGADGTQEQALVAEDIDRADDVIDDTLRYLEAGCTHYVVGWFCDRSDDVKDIAGRLQEAQDAWRDLTDYVPPERGPDDEPPAQAQQELYTDQAIGSSLPDNPSADDIVALAAELEARRAGDTPATNHLPDEVSAPTGDPEAPIAPASWAPDLVRCFKEYRDGDNLAVIEHGCVGTPMDCEDAGGEPSARLPDCDGWCERNAALAPGLSFEELDGSGDVLCHPLTCVEAFTPDSATVKPLVNEQCCINGFDHPVCTGAPDPTDPPPAPLPSNGEECILGDWSATSCIWRGRERLGPSAEDSDRFFNGATISFSASIFTENVDSVSINGDFSFTVPYEIIESPDGAGFAAELDYGGEGGGTRTFLVLGCSTTELQIFDDQGGTSPVQYNWTFARQ